MVFICGSSRSPFTSIWSIAGPSPLANDSKNDGSEVTFFPDVVKSRSITLADGLYWPLPASTDDLPDMYISSYKEHYFNTVHSFVERPMLKQNHEKGIPYPQFKDGYKAYKEFKELNAKT